MPQRERRGDTRSIERKRAEFHAFEVGMAG
jgi:hypothetical protein